MAAVVSLGVATAVVPQQGYAANILTPSITQVSLPLRHVHMCIYTHKHTVPMFRLSSCPSSNPVIHPLLPFLFSWLKLVLLFPNLAIASVEGQFLAGLGDNLPSEKLLCSWQVNWPSRRLAGGAGSQPSLPRCPLPGLGRRLSRKGRRKQPGRRWVLSCTAYSFTSSKLVKYDCVQ